MILRVLHAKYIIKIYTNVCTNVCVFARELGVLHIFSEKMKNEKYDVLCHVSVMTVFFEAFGRLYVNIINLSCGCKEK